MAAHRRSLRPRLFRPHSFVLRAPSGAPYIGRRTHCSLLSLPKFPDQYPRKMHRPFPFAFPPQSQRVAHKRLPHKPLSSLPPDLTVAAHSPHQPTPPILQSNPPKRRALRSIHLPWRSLLEPFVRPDLVVSLYPAIGPSLLSTPIGRSRSRRLGFENTVHLFVSPILFGVPRSNEFDPDSQSRPPRAQSRKTGRPTRCERPAIVDSDHSRVSILRKQPPKDSARWSPTLIGQQTNGQHVAAEQIPHRQGFDSLAISSPKPALEIDGPDLIAPVSDRQGRALQLGAARSTLTSAATELQSLQPNPNRPGRWRTLRSVHLSQAGGQFSAAPAPVPPPQPPNSSYPSRRGLKGRAVGTSASISESTTTLSFETSYPFVTSLATDPKPPTQLRHALLGLQSQLHKPQPSHHTRHIFP